MSAAQRQQQEHGPGPFSRPQILGVDVISHVVEFLSQSGRAFAQTNRAWAAMCDTDVVWAASLQSDFGVRFPDQPEYPSLQGDDLSLAAAPKAAYKGWVVHQLRVGTLRGRGDITLRAIRAWRTIVTILRQRGHQRIVQTLRGPLVRWAGPFPHTPTSEVNLQARAIHAVHNGQFIDSAGRDVVTGGQALGLFGRTEAYNIGVEFALLPASNDKALSNLDGSNRYRAATDSATSLDVMLTNDATAPAFVSSALMARSLAGSGLGPGYLGLLEGFVHALQVDGLGMRRWPPLPHMSAFPSCGPCCTVSQSNGIRIEVCCVRELATHSTAPCRMQGSFRRIFHGRGMRWTEAFVYCYSVQGLKEGGEQFWGSSCRLLTRHWDFRMSSGAVEVIEGPGVIGYMPLFARDGQCKADVVADGTTWTAEPFTYASLTSCHAANGDRIVAMSGWFGFSPVDKDTGQPTGAQFQVRINELEFVDAPWVF